MGGVLRLDLIVATFNRCAMLRKTLDSVLAAPIPPTLEVVVTVVDNNSSDDTREVVAAYSREFGGRLKYLFEKEQGQCCAINAGIRATTGDVIGMIDDDEQVDPNWFVIVAQWFAAEGGDFIGGPYRPAWEIPPPTWIPFDYSGVIGCFDSVPEVRTFGSDPTVMLPGGNAVVRRSAFDRVGLYSPALLRNGDDDMYRRLLAAGLHGKYVPELAIYHHIPASRLTKSYYRSWVFRKGIYWGQESCQRPEPVPHLFGIPRYFFGNAVHSFRDLLGRVITGKVDSSCVMSAELHWWCLAGVLYGRHFCYEGGDRLPAG